VPAGSIRILRSFIGQIFERGSHFHGPLLAFRNDFSIEFRKQWDKSRDVRYPELRKLKDEDFHAIFAHLESERVFWRAALCIRLFFEFGSPLTRVLQGQWCQIEGDYWYPYWPDEKVLWYESRERISDKARSILNMISTHSKFGETLYWFPAPTSTSANRVRSISSVESMWRKTLAERRMVYYPLREFARSYRNPNCPSYYINFLRQYGEHFRKIDNVAELSKRLMTKKNEK
jgi:hypothetical protein